MLLKKLRKKGVVVVKSNLPPGTCILLYVYPTIAYRNSVRNVVTIKTNIIVIFQCNRNHFLNWNVIFTQSSMIEITFLSKDTIGIIATRVYQVDHGRCTIYFFVLWVNLLVLCFQDRMTYVLFRCCHTFIRHRPFFYWKWWGKGAVIF